MPRKRVNKRGAKKYHRKRKAYKGKKKYSKIQSLIVRQPGVVIPDRTFCKMMYTDTTSNLLATAGNTFGFIRYNANGLFDPNPLILTGTVPGFKAMSGLYERYRVRGCKIKVTFANQEAFPANVLIWPTTEDVSGSVSNVYLQEMLDNAFCRYKTVSAKGGMDRGVLSSYISFKKLAGTGNVITDKDYSATTSANPAVVLFWNIGTYSITATSFTAASIPFECRLTFYVEWYDRLTLSS